MAKKKEKKAAVRHVPQVSTKYRCNKCGKVNDTKNCCIGGNDYTQQLIQE
jgi:hypothetical protein